MKDLLDDSIEMRATKEADGEKGLRWYLTLDGNEFKQICKSMVDTIKNKSSTFKALINHFNTICFDYFALFEEWHSYFFHGFLNLSVFLFSYHK